MSIKYCDFCGHNYDQDYEVEHEEDCAIEYYGTTKVSECKHCFTWVADKLLDRDGLCSKCKSGRLNKEYVNVLTRFFNNL